MNDSITSAGVLALILKENKQIVWEFANGSAPAMLLFPSHKAADVSFIPLKQSECLHWCYFD